MLAWGAERRVAVEEGWPDARDAAGVDGREDLRVPEEIEAEPDWRGLAGGPGGHRMAEAVANGALLLVLVACDETLPEGKVDRIGLRCRVAGGPARRHWVPAPHSAVAWQRMDSLAREVTPLRLPNLTDLSLPILP